MAVGSADLYRAEWMLPGSKWRFGSVAQSAALAFSVLTASPTIYATLTSIIAPVSGTRAVSGVRGTALHKHLLDAYEEMRSYTSLADGWDGPGSIAPSSQTISAALSVLSVLPERVSAPEAGATADGSAEWYWVTDQGLATLSLRGNQLAYYARSGRSVAQATVTFDGRSLPSDLLAVLSEL